MREDELRKIQGKRLQDARRDAGFKSAREAALESGWPESSYRAHEAGTRTIGLDDADRYVKRFRALGVPVSAQTILFGANGAAPEVAVRHVPLISWVAAGKLVDSSSQVDVADAPLLPFADLGAGDYIALRVAGDSMDRVSPEGSIILVNRDDRELLKGRAYVFSIRGEATFKAWQPKPAALVPRSTNGAHEPRYLDSRKGLFVVGRVRRTVLDL